MPDDRPESPDLRELVREAREILPDAALRSGRISDWTARANAALSTPAGPSPEPKFASFDERMDLREMLSDDDESVAPSPREEAVAVDRLDVEAARDYVLDFGGEAARDLVANLEVALSAARPSSPEEEKMRTALIECARASGADLSDGVPTWPPVYAWALQEVRRLRADYDDALKEIPSSPTPEER